MPIGAYPVWTFEPNWDSEFTETFEFLTNVLVSPSGAEQRRALRDFPRRSFEFNIAVNDANRSALNYFITVHGGRKLYVPIWHDKYIVSSASAKNIFSPAVDDDMMLRIDDVCIIMNGDPMDYEVFIVDAIQSDRIRSVSTLAKTWPAGSHVYRLIEAQFAEQPSLDALGAYVGTTQVKFQSLEENDIHLVGPIPIRHTSSAASARPLVQPNSRVVAATVQDTDDPTGTAKDQFILAAAFFAASEVLALETTEDMLDAAAYYLGLAQDLMDGMGDGDENTPILRRPIPDDSDVINLPQWLFVARGSEVEHTATLDDTFTVDEGGQTITIPPGNFRGELVEHVYSIYPSTGALFLKNPFSPAYDYEAPTVQVQWSIADGDWDVDEDIGTIIQMPDGAEDLEIADWNVVYRYPTTNLLELNEAFHVIPTVHIVLDGFVHHTPDTLRYAERALTRAIAQDDRADMATAWTKLRSSWRKSDLKGRQIDDQRWIIRPTPLADPIPTLDDWPSGFFCYSDNSGAAPPGAVESTDADWTGFDFWSRDTNGDVIATVPADTAVTRVQYGRVFADQWRTAVTGQDPDQFLYVSLSCSHKPTADEYFLVWVSQTDDDDETNRWFADIGSLGTFVATTLASGTSIDFLIARTSFKRRSYDEDGATVWGTALPAGQILKSFGISAEMDDAYTIRLRSMRMLAGATAGAVTGDLAAAKRGYVMPYSPGVSPALINANLDKQEFLGGNGSPLHGYQFADVWKLVETEAATIYTGLVPGSLPVPDRTTNVVGYPISATTTVGSVTKTPAALLVEQQLRFLKAAQEQWVVDGGTEGPFAHTYTMNTYDRFSYVDQGILKWVYENFSYSAWGGYQYRIVDSLVQFLDLTSASAAYSDARAIAVPLLTKFIGWVNTTWPNLDGQLGSVDGLVIHSGDETSYHQFTGEEYPIIEGYIE